MKPLSLLLAILFLSSCASWSPHEKRLGAAMLTAHLANAYTTERMLDNGNWEMNPILGQYPSDRRVGVYFSLSGALKLFVAHLAPKYRVKILYGFTALNTGFVVYDVNLMNE